MPDHGDAHDGSLTPPHTAVSQARPSGVSTHDGRRDDPAVRDLLRRALADEVLRLLLRRARPGPCGGRVPGDVPAGAAGIRPAEARRASPRVGADDRDPRDDRHDRRAGEPVDELPEVPRGRRPTRVRGARVPHRLRCRPRSAPPSSSATATTSTTTRSAPHSTRAPTPPVRRRPRACGGCEGGHMTVPTDLDRRFRDAAVQARAARRGLRRRSRARSARCSWR